MFKVKNKNTELPDKPNWDKINELTIQINRSVIDRWKSQM